MAPVRTARMASKKYSLVVSPVMIHLVMHLLVYPFRWTYFSRNYYVLLGRVVLYPFSYRTVTAAS
jgi:hypothetical protein